MRHTGDEGSSPSDHTDESSTNQHGEKGGEQLSSTLTFESACCAGRGCVLAPEVFTAIEVLERGRNTQWPV